MYTENIDTTTTSSLQSTSTAIPVSTTITTTTATPIVNATEVPTEEIPITRRSEFIIAMIVVGLVLILVLCVVMLCFVRPKQGLDGPRRRRKPLILSPYSGVLTPSSTTCDFSAIPSEHGWVPNQPPVVGNCYSYNYTMQTFLQEDINDNETLLQRKRAGHYSPRRAQQWLDTQWQNEYVEAVKSDLVSSQVKLHKNNCIEPQV